MNQLAASAAVDLEELIGELAEDYAQRLARGERPAVEEYAARHPEAAAALRQILPALEIMAATPAFERPEDLAAPADEPQRTLGDFRLIREIGRGGMGVVYEAEQLSIGRRVALKVLPFAAMLDKQQLNRFKNEARAAGTLDHPNIVQVFSVGVERGVHYYAMQLVEGESLAQVIERLRKETRLRNGDCGLRNEESDATIAHQSAIPNLQSEIPTAVAALSTLPAANPREYFRTVARLGVQAAEALDHAHQNGILHRDVKPANLMVDDAGKLWITDFGLARLEADAGMTMTGDLIGTLRYMSPEQALGKCAVIDHRSDIYSLGITLYEVLTLEPAVPAVDRQEVLRQIAFHDPRRLRQVNARIPQDLETVVAKAIEKDPSDRYATAQQLADDLTRFVSHQPIKARPATLLQRLAKWSRRHVAIVWSAAAASLLTAAAFGASAVLIARSRSEANRQRTIATTEKDEAIAQRNRAQLNQYYAEIVTGQADLDQGNFARLNQKLIRHLPVGDEQDYRGWEWYYLYTYCHPESRSLYFPYQRMFASWSPDGELIASAGVIWKAATGECVRYFTPTDVLGMDVAWSPDSQKLAWTTVADDSAVYVWDRRTDSIQVLRGHKDTVWCVAFSPDGKQLASASLDDSLKIWDVKKSAVIQTLLPGGDATDVTWSPDGKLLAVGLWGHGLHIYDASTGELVTQRDEPGQPRVRLAWRPDGRQLAVNTPRHWYVLDCAKGSMVLDHDHPGGATSPSTGGDIAWNPTGSQLAYSEWQHVTIWDPAVDRPVATLAGHVDPINSLNWSPDGRRLVTTDSFKELRIWDLQRPVQPPAIAAGGPLAQLSWESESDAILSVAAADFSISTWNSQNGQRIKNEKPKSIDGLVPGNLSPNRRRIAQPSRDGVGAAIIVRDASTGAVRAIWRPQESFAPVEYAWSPDGSKLAITMESSTDRGLECWDADTEQTISRWTSPKVEPDWADNLSLPTWSPDGVRVAVHSWGDPGDSGNWFYSSHVRVFDVVSGRQVLKRALGNRPRFGGEITALAWSADSRRLALGSSEGFIDIVDVDAQRGVTAFRTHDVEVSALQWSPNGRRLATAGANGDVKLIEPLSGTELLTLHVARSTVTHVAWSADGRRLAAASDDGGIHVWDASRAYEFAAGGARVGELAWAYLQLADESIGDAIDQALQKCVELAPSELGYRFLRGAALARLRQYDDAAKEFGAAVPPRSELGLRMALMQQHALLGARDLDSFRELHRRLVHGLTDLKCSDGTKNTLGGVAALVPDATDGFEEYVTFVRDALARPAAAGELACDPMFILPCGAMEYRLGRYEEAVATLATITARLVDAQDQNGQFELACAKYFLGMARRQLGHEAPAQRLLDEARGTDDALQADPNLLWTDRVVLDTLRREARLMIEP